MSYLYRLRGSMKESVIEESYLNIIKEHPGVQSSSLPSLPTSPMEELKEEEIFKGKSEISIQNQGKTDTDYALFKYKKQEIEHLYALHSVFQLHSKTSDNLDHKLMDLDIPQGEKNSLELENMLNAWYNAGYYSAIYNNNTTTNKLK